MQVKNWLEGDIQKKTSITTGDSSHGGGTLTTAETGNADQVVTTTVTKLSSDQPLIYYSQSDTTSTPPLQYSYMREEPAQQWLGDLVDVDDFQAPPTELNKPRLWENWNLFTIPDPDANTFCYGYDLTVDQQVKATSAVPFGAIFVGKNGNQPKIRPISIIPPGAVNTSITVASAWAFRSGPRRYPLPPGFTTPTRPPPAVCNKTVRPSAGCG